MIEMLVAMSTAVVVFAATVGFFAIVINQQNNVSSRTAAINQAQAGLQQLTRDLRNAVDMNPGASISACPSMYCNVSVATSTTNATTSLTFEIPTGSGGLQQVIWTCPNTASTGVGACTRSVNGGTAQQVITGVKSVAFVLTEDTSPTTTVTPSTTVSGTTTYPATTSTSSIPPLASVGITLNVYDISQLDRGRSSVVHGITNPIVIQTSAELRNFA